MFTWSGDFWLHNSSDFVKINYSFSFGEMILFFYVIWFCRFYQIFILNISGLLIRLCNWHSVLCLSNIANLLTVLSIRMSALCNDLLNCVVEFIKSRVAIFVIVHLHVDLGYVSCWLSIPMQDLSLLSLCHHSRMILCFLLIVNTCPLSICPRVSYFSYLDLVEYTGEEPGRGTGVNPSPLQMCPTLKFLKNIWSVITNFNVKQKSVTL